MKLVVKCKDSDSPSQMSRFPNSIALPANSADPLNPRCLQMQQCKVTMHGARNQQQIRISHKPMLVKAQTRHNNTVWLTIDVDQTAPSNNAGQVRKYIQ